MNTGFPVPERLRPGRHNLSREFVTDHQRERILVGVALACTELGYHRITVEDITKRAGLSRKTFYELYANKEEAFLAACDETFARLFEAIEANIKDETTLTGRTVGTFEALVEIAIAQPEFARLYLVEVMAAGPDAAKRRDRIVDGFSELVRTYAGDHLDDPPPPLTAEMVVGGLYEVIFTRVLEGDVEELRALMPDLAYNAALPYIGAEGAEAMRAEARRRLAARA